jgi:hypothetical protein
VTCIPSIALSLHLGLNHAYNNIHPHIRCEHLPQVTGLFYNSERNLSAYIAHTITIANTQLELGLVTGYDRPVVPLIRLTYKDFYITPALETDTHSIGVVIGIEFKIATK